MKILAMGKTPFDKLMFEKGITPTNVEQQDKLLFISINNNKECALPDEAPFFPENKKNVKVLYFADIDKDAYVPLIDGSKRKVLARAMTKDQAKELYSFIKDNIKGKEAVLIHCTMGVSRSGAVASFIHDYISGKWEDFKRDNPKIQPNAHVYRLLHDEWYEELKYPKGWTEDNEKDFQVEIMNPRTREQEIAMYNELHKGESIMREDLLTEDEIKEKYGEQWTEFLKRN